jgi:hypothetical protein
MANGWLTSWHLVKIQSSGDKVEMLVGEGEVSRWSVAEREGVW